MSEAKPVTENPGLNEAASPASKALDAHLSIKPNEVVELENVLRDMSVYRDAVLSASFPIRVGDAAAKLERFLKESYSSIYPKYSEHPWVVEAKQLVEQKQNELEARMKFK